MITTFCFAQEVKEYPLLGKWKAIPASIELNAATAAYGVEHFILDFELQKSAVSVFFGSISKNGVRTDYLASSEHNAILKKTDFRNKRKITFKALYPYANVKGRVRVSLIHPDTLLWETLWLPSTVKENYIPKRAKLIRRK